MSDSLADAMSNDVWRSQVADVGVRPPDDAGFRGVARLVVGRLASKYEMGAWMVTRVDAEDWTMLEVADRTYGIQPGDRFRWEDSYCSRMVVGEAPQIAGDSRTVDTFRTQGINLHATIRSYLGAPIRSGDGTLFGTLCAIDPDTRRFDEYRVATWLEKSAETLNSVLALEEAGFRRAWESLERRTSGARFGIHRAEDWLRFVALARRRALSIGTPYGLLVISRPTRGDLP
ncbi:MAG: GAF domain-containing protein, partial [Acidimicrobiales bacterium]